MYTLPAAAAPLEYVTPLVAWVVPGGGDGGDTRVLPNGDGGVPLAAFATVFKEGSSVFFWRVALGLALWTGGAFGEPYAERLEALRLREQALAAEYQGLVEAGLVGEPLMAQIEAAASALTPDELKRLGGRRRSEETVTTLPSPGERRARELLEQLDSRVKPFQERFDHFNDDKLDLILGRFQEFATHHLDQLEKYGGKRSERLVQLHGEMQESLATFLSLRDKAGTPSDRDRGKAAQRYLAQLHSFGGAAGYRDRTWRETLGAPLAWVTERIAFIAENAAHLPELSSTYSALRRGSGAAAALAPSMERRLRWRGERMGVEGRENIPAPEPGVLTVYTPAHPHTLYDVSTVTSLGLQDAAVLTAIWPKQFGLADAITDSKEFILVKAGGGNPAKAVANFFRDGKASSLVAFPQGGVHDLSYGERPPQDNFALLMQLVAREGIQLRIVPVSQPFNQRFGTSLGKGMEGIDVGQPVTIVHPSLSPQSVQFLLGADRLNLNRVIRQVWIESDRVHRPQDWVIGMPSVDRLGEGFNRLFAAKSYCGAYLQKLNSFNQGAPIEISRAAPVNVTTRSGQ